MKVGVWCDENSYQLPSLSPSLSPTNLPPPRLAAQAQNLKKAEGPRKLYVGSLHYNINETMLKKIFESFGNVSRGGRSGSPHRMSCMFCDGGLPPSLSLD